jgi:hypothetical protein
MATYVNDLRLKEIGTGESSGTWGTETNVNLELIGEALGYGTEGITTNADTHTTTVADGATDPGRAMYIKYTGTLDSACTITIGPNTINRLHYIENATSGSQNIIISQGSGANITIPAGDTKAVYLDGAGSGAAVVDVFASFSAVDLKVQDDLTVTDDATVGGTLGVTGILTCTDDIIIGDGKTIGSASDVDAMTIASNGQVTFTQTLIGTALDISGDIDVDGTSNLDVVDIDGAVDMASTLQVDGVATFTGRDIHSGGITIANAGQIGSVGTVGAIAIASNGVVTLSAGLAMSGGTADIDGAVDMASTLQVDGAITSSAGMTLTVADNSDVLTIVSTDADASSGPNITLYRNSGSPADSDNLGDIHFKGRNDNSQDVEYAVIDGRIVDASDGTEDGKLEIVTIVAGSGASRINMINTETVLNDDSIDLDLRVESNGNANMLFVDGGNDRVGIGEGSPAATLHINTSTNSPLVVESTSGTGGYIELQVSDSGGAGSLTGYIGDSEALIASGTAADFAIRAQANLVFSSGGSTERARITSDGISVTGTVTQSTAKTAQFTGQYDGRETDTITLGSLGFKPQVLFCIFNVGTTQAASWGMAARDGGGQALLDYDLQAAADGYESVTTSFGRLAFGSAVFSNLAVSAWNADNVVIQKSVDNSGSSSTCKYKIIVMG